MKILITGANGFIGQHLVNYLSKRNHEVYAMVRKGSSVGFELNKNVNLVVGDLTDTHSMEGGIPADVTVVNLAANPYDPKLSRLVNVEGTRKLISVLEKKKIGRLIHISSQATKIKVKGVYSITKGGSDKLVEKSNLNWVILKPSLVYGEGEKGLFNKIKGLVRMLPFVPVFGNGEVEVCPLHISDLCRYIELTAEDKKTKGVVYDIGSLTPVSYNYFYSAILKYLGKKNPLLHIPVWMGIMAGILFNKMGMKNPPFFVDNVLGSTQPTDCDAKPIAKKYGFKPMDFDEGLKKIFKKSVTKVAVVGLGKMGMMHLAALSSLEDVKVVALIDSNVKAWSVIRSMGVEGNFYASLDEALRHEDIDGVFILTPTFTHNKLLMQCLKKGLSVFVEKPLCVNQDEIEELRKVAKNYKGKVFVGYTLLFKRAVMEVKRLIVSEKYGKVKSFKASYEHGEVFGPRVGWMFDKARSGGGVMMNPGPHIFSVVSYLLGVPNKITGRVDKLFSETVDDEANLNFDYAKFSGEVYLSWSVKGVDIPKMNFEVEFEKATVWTDGKTLKIMSDGVTKVMSEKEMMPLVEGLFELNPDANGEAYVTEDYLFVKSMVAGKLDNELVTANDLNWVLDTESVIHEVYKVSNFK